MKLTCIFTVTLFIVISECTDCPYHKINFSVKQPQVVPSGNVPEGIVVTGGIVLCGLLSLKTFYWNELWRWKIVIFMILTVCRCRLRCMLYVLLFNKFKK
jgi:hypothetical protein